MVCHYEYATKETPDVMAVLEAISTSRSRYVPTNTLSSPMLLSSYLLLVVMSPGSKASDFQQKRQ